MMIKKQTSPTPPPFSLLLQCTSTHQRRMFFFPPPPFVAPPSSSFPGVLCCSSFNKNMVLCVLAGILGVLLMGTSAGLILALMPNRRHDMYRLVGDYCETHAVSMNEQIEQIMSEMNVSSHTTTKSRHTTTTTTADTEDTDSMPIRRSLEMIDNDELFEKNLKKSLDGKVVRVVGELQWEAEAKTGTLWGQGQGYYQPLPSSSFPDDPVLRTDVGHNGCIRLRRRFRVYRRRRVEGRKGDGEGERSEGVGRTYGGEWCDATNTDYDDGNDVDDVPRWHDRNQASCSNVSKEFNVVLAVKAPPPPDRHVTATATQGARGANLHHPPHQLRFPLSWRFVQMLHDFTETDVILKDGGAAAAAVGLMPIPPRDNDDNNKRGGGSWLNRLFFCGDRCSEEDNERTKFTTIRGFYTSDGDPENPKIGDVWVSYEAVHPGGPYTLVGRFFTSRGGTQQMEKQHAIENGNRLWGMLEPFSVIRPSDLDDDDHNHTRQLIARLSAVSSISSSLWPTPAGFGLLMDQLALYLFPLHYAFVRSGSSGQHQHNGGTDTPLVRTDNFKQLETVHFSRSALRGTIIPGVHFGLVLLICGQSLSVAAVSGLLLGGRRRFPPLWTSFPLLVFGLIEPTTHGYTKTQNPVGSVFRKLAETLVAESSSTVSDDTETSDEDEDEDDLSFRCWVPEDIEIGRHVTAAGVTTVSAAGKKVTHDIPAMHTILLSLEFVALPLFQTIAFLSNCDR